MPIWGLRPNGSGLSMPSNGQPHVSWESLVWWSCWPSSYIPTRYRCDTMPGTAKTRRRSVMPWRRCVRISGAGCIIQARCSTYRLLSFLRPSGTECSKFCVMQPEKAKVERRIIPERKRDKLICGRPQEMGTEGVWTTARKGLYCATRALGNPAEALWPARRHADREAHTRAQTRRATHHLGRKESLCGRSTASHADTC